MELREGARCLCKQEDPAVLAAGAMNAICGWIVSFAIMHEMVNRVNVVWPNAPRQRLAEMLLSPPAILLGGIGSLAASSVLKSGITITDPKADEMVQSSSQLTIALVGLGLWSASLCGLGALSWLKAKPVRCASGIALLAFCGLVMFMASGYPFGPGPVEPTEQL